MTKRQRVIWRRIGMLAEEHILRYYRDNPQNNPEGHLGLYLAIRAFEAGRRYEKALSE